MQITRSNPFVPGETNTMEIDVTRAQIRSWEEGTLIQNAFPHLTADEREFIKTGITPESWEKMLGNE